MEGVLVLGLAVPDGGHVRSLYGDDHSRILGPAVLRLRVVYCGRPPAPPSATVDHQSRPAIRRCALLRDLHLRLRQLGDRVLAAGPGIFLGLLCLPERFLDRHPYLSAGSQHA